MNGLSASRFATRLAAGAVLAIAVAAGAQTSTPAADTAALNSALRSLSQNPKSVEALVSAGAASLKVEDVDAALGFFRRAIALSPQDSRAKAGMASVMVRRRQPLEGLRLFAEAEQTGPLSSTSYADRGLAYDLIGDNARAQSDYSAALAGSNDPMIIRRLALSQAIGGDERAAEATLLPLLQTRDLAAYRTRAFALAVSGRGDEAVSITETMLPATLSSRMAPYLRYMPRLTRAQQAAAADLGAFPRAGDIGRDDPQIAAYASTLGIVPVAKPQSIDARLVPSGAPLGGLPRGQAQRPTVAAATPAPSPVRPRTGPKPEARASSVPVAVAAPVAAPSLSPSAPAPAVAEAKLRAPRAEASPSGAMLERERAMLMAHPELRNGAPLPTKPAATPPVVALGPALAAAPSPVPLQAAPAAASAPTAPLAPTPLVKVPEAAPALAVSPARMPTVPAPSPLSTPPASAAVAPAAAGPPPPASPSPALRAEAPPAEAPPPVVVSRLTEVVPPPSAAAGEAAPGFTATAPATTAASPAPGLVTAASPPHRSLADAFGDLRAVPAQAAPAGAEAVDITKIQPRRPAPPSKPAAPKPPPVPSREWVQVATGRSTDALAFDWRRLKKEAAGALDKEKPSTAEWGRTNRLVVGPFASSAAADKMVARLKDKKIDAFRFTSDEGQAVEPLE